MRGSISPLLKPKNVFGGFGRHGHGVPVFLVADSLRSVKNQRSQTIFEASKLYNIMITSFRGATVSVPFCRNLHGIPCYLQGILSLRLLKMRSHTTQVVFLGGKKQRTSSAGYRWILKIVEALRPGIPGNVLPAASNGLCRNP